jgi:hypothetical protein
MEYNQTLRKLNMPTLKYRRARGDMIEVFKILNGIYDTHATIGMMEVLFLQICMGTKQLQHIQDVV